MVCWERVCKPFVQSQGGKVGVQQGLKGQTLPLRFGQFKHACWTTSLSTLTLMGVAVLKDLKYTTTLSLDTAKKPKPRIPKKKTNQKYQKNQNQKYQTNQNRKNQKNLKNHYFRTLPEYN